MTDATPPLAELLARRRSGRAFSREPVADEVVRSLLEAARWAPSYGNRQSWRFIVARDPAVLEAVRGALTRGNAYATVAPVLIAVCGDPYDGQIVDGVEYHLMDAGLALENLLLQATALGLVCHPLGGFDRATVHAALRLPATARVLALVALGWPGSIDDLDEHTLERELRPRVRKPLEEIAAWDRWPWEPSGGREQVAPGTATTNGGTS